MALMAVGLLGLFPTGPAAALSCAPVNLEEVIENDPIVFIGEQIEESDDTKFQRFRVDRWIRGGSGDEITMERSLDWGSSYLDRGVRLFRGWPTEGRVETSLCGNGWSLLEALTVLDGHPEPQTGGTAAFVVAMDTLTGIIGAVLNEDAEVVHYAEGDVKIHEFASCPGDDLVAAVVSDPPEDFGDVPASAEWAIEVRRSGDLGLVNRSLIDARTSGQWNAPAIGDLECHDADASLITALEQRWRNDPIGSRPVRYEGSVVMIRDDELTQLKIAWPRDVARDPGTGVIHVINGRDGRTVTSIDADGTTSDRELPGTHVGWHLTVENDEFEIISEDTHVDQSNLSAGIVSHVLRGPFDALESTALPLETSYGSFGGILDTPDGRVLHLIDQDTPILVPLDDLSERIPVTARWHQRLAVGSTVTLIDNADVESGVARLDPTTDTAEAIEGLLYANSPMALMPTEPIVYDEPLPPIPLLPISDESEGDETTSTTSTPPTSSTPTETDSSASDTSSAWLVWAGAAFAVIAGTAVVAVARKRSR